MPSAYLRGSKDAEFSLPLPSTPSQAAAPHRGLGRHEQSRGTRSRVVALAFLKRCRY